MSEQYGQGYSGPPTGSTMAPPPPPPPGVYAQPQAPQPEPKKKRTGLIVAIVLVIVLCGLGGCVAAIMALGSGGDDTETITQAESHFSAMMSAVGTATTSLKEFNPENSDATPVKQVVDEANTSLRVARDEIAASRASIEQLDQSQGRTDYLAALEAATQSIDGLEDMLAYLSKGADMLDQMSDGAKYTKDANELLNDAISAGNSSKYDKMKDKANSAAGKYAKAATLFDAAHASDEAAGIDQAAKYARKRREVALVVVQMAKDGKAGRVSAYNKGIKKMKKLEAAAEKYDVEAAMGGDWYTSRLEEIDAKANAAAQQADELRAKALGELEYTD